MKLEKPKLSKYIEDKKLNDEDDFIDMIFDNEVLNHSIEDKEWNGSVFKNIDFSSQQLKNIDIIDCIFDSCDLSNLEIGNTFLRCEFKNCKLIGFNIDQASCKNIYFDNCILDFSLISDSVLEKVKIENSSMIDARMYNLTFKELELIDSNLSNLEIINTKLKNIDLSSCNIDKIKVNGKDLEGVILGVDQLIDVANIFGINIK